MENQPQNIPPAQPAPGASVPAPVVDQSIKYILPINRSGLSIAASYVALFSFPFILPAFVALGLGIAALVQLKKTPGKWGRGRSLFAVIYGGAISLLTIVFIVYEFVRGFTS